MDWVRPLYSREQVNAAGRELVRWDALGEVSLDDVEQWTDAMGIVNNWRASHHFPLNTFQVTLRDRARRIDPRAVVTQRLKRVPSVTKKLQRFKSMSLARMQDIGGCRAIVGTTAQVLALRDVYLNSSARHIQTNIKDYIDSPQDTGYRGIHLVYRYTSDRATTYNNHLIEVQLRSKLQHAWATGVETVGMMLGQALKSNEGEQDVLAFFKLASWAFAYREGTPVPEGTAPQEELLEQLCDMEDRLHVLRRLDHYRHAIAYVDEGALAEARYYYYLMVFSPDKNQIQITGYAKDAFDRATSDYAEQEKRLKSEKLDAVLVAAESMATLRTAYPNYFGDTEHFIKQMRKVLARQ